MINDLLTELECQGEDCGEHQGAVGCWGGEGGAARPLAGWRAGQGAPGVKTTGLPDQAVFSSDHVVRTHEIPKLIYGNSTALL